MKELYWYCGSCIIAFAFVALLIVASVQATNECHDKGGTYIRDAGCVKLEKLP